MSLKRSISILLILFIVFISCKKEKIEENITYTEPSELRLGTYTGMFQECGSIVCYNKDTTFQIIKEDNKYFLVFGDHKDEIKYSTPIAKDFTSVETNNIGSQFAGYCQNDSAYVVFSEGWGIYNKNLLSGKKK